MSLPFIILNPKKYAKGHVYLPGSKSISNRVLLLAALAKGTTTIEGLLESEDTHIMLNAIKALDVNWVQQDQYYLITGGQHQFKNKKSAFIYG